MEKICSSLLSGRKLFMASIAHGLNGNGPFGTWGEKVVTIQSRVDFNTSRNSTNF